MYRIQYVIAIYHSIRPNIPENFRS